MTAETMPHFSQRRFISTGNRIDRKAVKGLTEETMGLFMQISWKDNVREFENLIERAVLTGKEGDHPCS